MTKLLISVRSGAEARIACRAGADLIDVKEPARGALGAADRETIDDVVREVAGRRPVSVALGELPHGATLDHRFADRVQYAKFGLAGCGICSDWVQRWQAAVAALPLRVTPVAVVYADWQQARAPDPREVLAHARRLGCGAVLLDTFDKSRGSLSGYIGLRELGEFIAELRRDGFTSVVAGGLRHHELAPIVALEPDYVGVRGAACTSDRTGELDERLARSLCEAIHQRLPMAEQEATRARAHERHSVGD